MSLVSNNNYDYLNISEIVAADVGTVEGHFEAMLLEMDKMNTIMAATKTCKLTIFSNL